MTQKARLVGPDVTRAVALLGVVVMNYHGYLNGSDAIAGPHSTWAQSLFDPWTGVLATRFAATFVTVAGIGITLLTERGRLGGDREAISADRWRLARRGLLLYVGGFILDWIWPGTILFYYGAFFLIGALLFTLRVRWLALIGSTAALASAALHIWAAAGKRDGHDVRWLVAPDTLFHRSPRGLLFDTFFNGTHPVLPWIAFLCVGIVTGRSVRRLPRQVLIPVGIGLTAFSYLLNYFGTRGIIDPVRLVALSTHPFDGGLLYTVGAIGTSLVAYCTISWIAERFVDALAVRTLALAGRTTLSIYILHVLVFNEVVHQRHWITANGLGTALLFALVFWINAVLVATWWQTFLGQPPLERIYRRFGG